MIAVAGVPGVRGLTISPDGSRLAFAGLSLDSPIWKQPVRGDGTPAAAATALTSDTSRRNSVPVISPDAARVAYVSTRRGLGLRAIDVASGRQQEIYAAGSPRVFVRYPDWSPRGDVMVFERGEMRANVWTLAIQPANATLTR